MTPAIEALTRRLSECPPEFLGEPRLKGRPEGVHVAAVVSDLLDDLGDSSALADSEVVNWDQAPTSDRNWLRLTLVTCWLCHDRWLREERAHGANVKAFLLKELRPLAKVVNAELFVNDPDRREELARALLVALKLQPAGESETQATDRLRSLSSVERARVVAETQVQAERARKLREKMQAEAAQQAASRYSSE